LNSKTLTKADSEYLTYSALGKPETWWRQKVAFEPKQAKDLLEKRLWEGDNLKQYKKKDVTNGLELEMTGLSKGLKKQYKRYLKKQSRKGLDG
jgi:hypothetical protein|tara:strand:- start:73 stop:351 length:279 start_codon:yes stop_codon:yes gene_type:complete